MLRKFSGVGIWFEKVGVGVEEISGSGLISVEEIFGRGDLV